MSKLSALQGKSKIYKIGEIELELKPLTLDDMELIAIDDKSSLEDQTKATSKLIEKVLSDAVPDSTEEERNNIGIKYMEELMKAVMDVNGMEGKQRPNIKDVIKARQDKATSSRPSG